MSVRTGSLSEVVVLHPTRKNEGAMAVWSKYCFLLKVVGY